MAQLCSGHSDSLVAAPPRTTQGTPLVPSGILSSWTPSSLHEPTPSRTDHHRKVSSQGQHSPSNQKIPTNVLSLAKPHFLREHLHQTVKADLNFKVWGFLCERTQSLQPRAASPTQAWSLGPQFLKNTQQDNSPCSKFCISM